MGRRWIGVGLLLAALAAGYLGTTPWGDALRHGEAMHFTWMAHGGR